MDKNGSPQLKFPRGWRKVPRDGIPSPKVESQNQSNPGLALHRLKQLVDQKKGFYKRGDYFIG